MAITFRCEHCGRQVEASAEAAGKRGKCPHCHEVNYIPLPPEQRDVIPLEDVDEGEEARRQAEIERLRQVERQVLAEETDEPPIPLEHRENLSVADLHHLAINYCLDMAAGKLDRAALHVDKLWKFGSLAMDAAADIGSGKVLEPALKAIPAPVLKGFCRQLQADLAAKK
ncbi:MAG: hypothetical protein NTV86_15100 [Planctomycetota bacterium]|nr:hypothetical protein [Planctomycetota bacterium]